MQGELLKLRIAYIVECLEEFNAHYVKKFKAPCHTMDALSRDGLATSAKINVYLIHFASEKRSRLR